MFNLIFIIMKKMFLFLISMIIIVSCEKSKPKPGINDTPKNTFNLIGCWERVGALMIRYNTNLQPLDSFTLMNTPSSYVLYKRFNPSGLVTANPCVTNSVAAGNHNGIDHFWGNYYQPFIDTVNNVCYGGFNYVFNEKICYTEPNKFMSYNIEAYNKLMFHTNEMHPDSLYLYKDIYIRVYP